MVEIKHHFCRRLCIPVNQLSLFSNGREMNDDNAAGQLAVRGSVPLRLVVAHSGPGGALVSLGRIQLEPTLGTDLTDSVDDGARHHRHGLPYSPPLGWCRYGMRYNRSRLCSGRGNGCFTGDKAILQSSPSKPGGQSLSRRYVDTQACFPGCPFSGIISTADLAAAERMATAFWFRGKEYKVLVENRINPETLTKKAWSYPMAGEVYVSQSKEDMLALRASHQRSGYLTPQSQELLPSKMHPVSVSDLEQSVLH